MISRQIMTLIYGSEHVATVDSGNGTGDTARYDTGTYLSQNSLCALLSVEWPFFVNTRVDEERKVRS